VNPLEFLAVLRRSGRLVGYRRSATRQLLMNSIEQHRTEGKLPMMTATLKSGLGRVGSIPPGLANNPFRVLGFPAPDCGYQKTAGSSTRRWRALFSRIRAGNFPAGRRRKWISHAALESRPIHASFRTAVENRVGLGVGLAFLRHFATSL
jgi:hypothetical protein